MIPTTPDFLRPTNPKHLRPVAPGVVITMLKPTSSGVRGASGPKVYNPILLLKKPGVTGLISCTGIEEFIESNPTSEKFLFKPTTPEFLNPKKIVLSRPGVWDITITLNRPGTNGLISNKTVDWDIVSEPKFAECLLPTSPGVEWPDTNGLVSCYPDTDDLIKYDHDPQLDTLH